jgi:hypothetical protein
MTSDFKSQATSLKSFEDMLNYLKREQVLHEPDEERRRVEIPTRVGQAETVLVVFWGEEVPLVQCICPLPIKVPEGRVSILESTIVRLNHQLDLAGFGFNHEKGLLYYRLTLPRRLPEYDLLGEELEKLCRIVVETVNKFYPKLFEVVVQGKSLKELRI